MQFGTSSDESHVRTASMGKFVATEVQQHMSPYNMMTESREGTDTQSMQRGATGDRRTGIEMQSVKTSTSTSTALDLQNNDGQFWIIANLVTSKYEEHIQANQKYITISADDKTHFDRIASKKNFVSAVQRRLRKGPAGLKEDMRTTLRKCQILGLHESGEKNPLYAPVGAKILLQFTMTKPGSVATQRTAKLGSKQMMERQQLLAELKEASALMTESVTPEATQFWRGQVLDLQNRLKSFHDVPGASSSVIAEEKEVIARNERMLGYLTEAEDRMNDSTFAGNSIIDNESQHTMKRGNGDHSQARLIESLENEFHDLQARNSGYLNHVDPEVQNVPMVDVVAPANLPEGYTFEAEINGKRFHAMVPAGGVRKGQTFSCYMRDIDSVADIPTGEWRDGLFEILSHGVFHPMLWNSLLCPLLALAQVMTRMGLDYTGRPNTEVPREGMWSTWGMAFTILGFWGMLNAMVMTLIRLKSVEGMPTSMGDTTSLVLINGGLMLYVIYGTVNTRRVIRNRYSIEAKFGDMEDVVAATACLPCTVAQMGRHTIPYEKNQGYWCTDTGLAPGVESDITSRKQSGSYRVW